MSKEDRDIQSILLYERWNLIQTDVNRRSIKIETINYTVYVNNQLFGQVQDNKFLCSDFSHVNNLSPLPSSPSPLYPAHTSPTQMDDANSS